MALPVTIDAEALLVRVLGAAGYDMAGAAAAGIGVALFQVTGTRSRKIADHRIQVDVWGAPHTSKAAVSAAARAIEAKIYDLESTIQTEGVVSGVEISGSPGWLPDPDTGRPRYTLGVTLFTHPA